MSAGRGWITSRTPPPWTRNEDGALLVAAGLGPATEHADGDQHVDVDRAQPGGRFVEDVEDAALAAAQPRRDSQPLLM
jgi:hypothetical protein